MYREIDTLTSLSDDCIVRRYMSMTKFLSVIQDSQFFFPSLDLLSREDKFEGLFNLLDHPLSNSIPLDNNFQRNYRKHCFVNCWNNNVYESYALWKIYLDGGNEGVAIETSFSKLKDCFKSFSEDIYIGKVDYAPGFHTASRFITCTTKRTQFEYENEVRVIYEKVPFDEHGKEQVDIPPVKSGYYIPIDLQVLFSRVITSPFAPSWFHGLVTGVMNKYGYTQVEVSKSTLASEPV
jgi:hypothetical protein